MYDNVKKLYHKRRYFHPVVCHQNLTGVCCPKPMVPNSKGNVRNRKIAIFHSNDFC